MSASSLAALLIAGTPVAADLPIPEALAQHADAEMPEAPEAPVADEASAGEPEPEYNEIIVSGSTEAPPGDPLIQLNAQSYEVTQAVDAAIVGPVAKGYEEVVPKPVRSGLRNFFRNLKAPIIALNFLLQLKPGKALETLGRFTVNSTIGLAGFIDVAKDEPFNLPYRPNGFANTLGYYGVEPGPFFFLPLVGPTTLRDLLGGAVDGMVLPTAVGAPFDRMEYTIPTGVVRALDYRIRFDEELQNIRGSDDPYTAAREYYLKSRQDEIDALRRVRVDSSAFAVPAGEPAPAAESAPSAPAEIHAPAPEDIPADVPELELQD